MDALTFDGLARQIGRRRTLQALGVAAVTAVSGASLTSAKNGKNNNKKQQRKKQQKRIDQESLALCASQVTPCNTFLASNCNGNAECLAAAQVCCAPLSTCDFAGFVTCLAETNGN